MSSFSHVPPVITVQRCVDVVAQTLKDLEQLLFFQNCVFQINGDFLLAGWHHTHVALVFKLRSTEPVHFIKTIHDLHAACISELALHEKLRIFTTLSS